MTLCRLVTPQPPRRSEGTLLSPPLVACWFALSRAQNIRQRWHLTATPRPWRGLVRLLDSLRWKKGAGAISSLATFNKHGVSVRVYVCVGECACTCACVCVKFRDRKVYYKTTTKRGKRWLWYDQVVADREREKRMHWGSAEAQWPRHRCLKSYRFFETDDKSTHGQLNCDKVQEKVLPFDIKWFHFGLIVRTPQSYFKNRSHL